MTFEILKETLLLSLAVQAVFFTMAWLFKTDKFTDFSYGLTFIALALFSAKSLETGSIQLFLTVAVCLWAIRLGTYLLVRILKIKKDRRFDRIRGSFLRFGGFWLLQGISVWVIILPVSLVLSKPAAGLTPLAVFGLAIWLAGLAIETIADWQKFTFKNRQENKGRWIETGLWKYSRHPNYFGEICLWWGLFVATLPYLKGGERLAIIGPLYLTFLLLFVSGIPPLEKSGEKKYGRNPDYRRYRERTSLLLPLLPRKK